MPICWLELPCLRVLLVLLRQYNPPETYRIKGTLGYSFALHSDGSVKAYVRNVVNYLNLTTDSVEHVASFPNTRRSRVNQLRKPHVLTDHRRQQSKQINAWHR